MKQIKFSKLELIDLSIIAMTLIQALPLLKGFSSIENTDFLLKGLNLLGLLTLSIYIVAKKYNKRKNYQKVIPKKETTILVCK